MKLTMYPSLIFVSVSSLLFYDSLSLFASFFFWQNSDLILFFLRPFASTRYKLSTTFLFMSWNRNSWLEQSHIELVAAPVLLSEHYLLIFFHGLSFCLDLDFFSPQCRSYLFSNAIMQGRKRAASTRWTLNCRHSGDNFTKHFTTTTTTTLCRKPERNVVRLKN